MEAAARMHGGLFLYQLPCRGEALMAPLYLGLIHLTFIFSGVAVAALDWIMGKAHQIK